MLFRSLFAALACVLGALILNNFPEPYHPVFNVPRFERASTDWKNLKAQYDQAVAPPPAPAEPAAPTK